jgi:threonine synthase
MICRPYHTEDFGFRGFAPLVRNTQRNEAQTMSDRRTDAKAVLIRIPADVDEWLRHQAERNWSSRNAEIVRLARDAMDAAEQPKKAAGQ